MTGICGWQGTCEGEGPPDSIIRRMCEGLPQSEGANCAITTFGGLASDGGLASEAGQRLTVAIEGFPRWRDDRLARIAREHGHGHALLAGYKDFGRNLLGRLAGSFALAVLDERKNELVLAIDRMGIRPLCYASGNEGRIIFGSTTDAILAHTDISPRLSQQSIYDYVYFHVVPSPATIYLDISKLEPGQILFARNGAIETSYYWKPTFSADGAARPAELQQELKAGLRSAVAHCEPELSTAGFLSGGLDSSTVCGLANEMTERPMRAYVIGFEQHGYDEIEYARVAARHFGLDLREYYVTPADIADTVDLIATNYDEPFGNSSAIPAFFCARSASMDGVSCLLAGDGGDELFAGNERYAEQLIFEYYQRLPRWLRSKVIEPVLYGLPTDRNKYTRKVRRYAEQARVPMPERFQTYNFLHMQPPACVFEPEFLQNIDDRAPIDAMTRWYDRHSDTDLVNRMLAYDWKFTLADNDIRKVNRMCDLAGVKVAYPLLDDDLVDFSTRIPSRLKLDSRHLRLFFKKAVSDFLPHQILTKEKHGFGLPFGDWLKSSDHLREKVMPAFDSLRYRGIFRVDFLDDLIRNHHDVHAAYYGNIIWVLIMLEYWLQARDMRSIAVS